MKKILVITDNVGHEAEVSQKSASFVVDVLQKRGYDVQQIFRDVEFGVADDVLNDIDFALPIVHGKYGEDGQITSFLQKRNIKTLFSDPEIHALCIDKQQTKQQLFASKNTIFEHEKYSLQFAWSEIITTLGQNITVPQTVKKIFVKPNRGGSSVDSGIFDSLSDAKDLIARILDYDTVLVEEYIENPRELTIALSGDYDKNIEVLGIMEILTERNFFDYQAKYEWAGTKEIFADLDPDFEHYLRTISVEIYKKLQIKTFARIDFLLKDNVLYFLEINTIPGMTEKSFLPQCVAHAGYESFGVFLEQFLG